MGLLNVLDVPYEPLVRAARETNQRLYQLMFGLAKPSQTWCYERHKRQFEVSGK
jgi:hypothetical protein